jgi:F-type H+-transporting ATPase subunit delta
MSLARTLLRRVAASSRAPLVRQMSDAAAPGLTLNFCLPHDAVYVGKSVEQVIIPGAEGEYGVTAGHSPIASQLKPGVLQILHGSGEEPEKFFVSGGFALTHESSVTDISAVEAFKLDDIDPEAVKESYASSKAKFDASSDEVEKATAQVAMETSRALAIAVGVAV